ncbi:MAG: hypothetical protein K2Q06_04260 [Parvularculaceae bacterium]|nr:hypothetical protein [Parvularculaceae bacterium]
MRAFLRSLRQAALFAAIAAAAPALTGCGFTPVYATNGSAVRPLLPRMHLQDVSGGETARETVRSVFERRLAPSDADALYDLRLEVREAAIPLAVQIDDSVTRYNYRLSATYTLTRRSDGKTIKGVSEAVASFNVVASQYSTLFAEKGAREKASSALADLVERSILLKMSEEERAAVDAARKAAGAQ